MPRQPRRGPRVMQQRIAADATKVAEIHARQVAGKTKRNYLLAGAGLGAAGAVYAGHRRRNAVYKLYDPFTDTEVELGKSTSFGGARRALNIPRDAKVFRPTGRRVRGVTKSWVNPAHGTSAGRAALRRAANDVESSTFARAKPRGRNPLPQRKVWNLDKAAPMRLVTAGTDVRFLPPRTPSGTFVSHTNKLKEVRITPHRNPTSRLQVVRRSARSVSGSSIGKGLDFGGRSRVGSQLP